MIEHVNTILIENLDTYCYTKIKNIDFLKRLARESESFFLVKNFSHFLKRDGHEVAGDFFIMKKAPHFCGARSKFEV